MAVVGYMLEKRFPEEGQLIASIYIDDINIYTNNPMLLKPIIDVVHEVLSQVGLEISMAKSGVWCTCPKQAREWHKKGTPYNIPQLDSFRMIGAWFHIRGRRDQENLRNQNMTALVRNRCKRIASLPVGKPVRAQIAGAMILPKMMFAPVGKLPPRDFDRAATTQLTLAAGGGKINNSEAREVEWSVAIPLHRHNAAVARIIRLIAMLQSLYASNPVGTLAQLFSLHDFHHKLTPMGVIATLLCAVERLGMKFEAPDLLYCTQEMSVPLLWKRTDMGLRPWQHMTREGMRCHFLSQLEARRPQFGGISAGVDRKRSFLSFPDRHMNAWLKLWQLDGLLLPIRLAKQQRCPPGLCVRCGLRPDTLFHRIWQCPRVNAERPIPYTSVQAMPSCVWMHGIVPVGIQIHMPFFRDMCVQVFHVFHGAESMDLACHQGNNLGQDLRFSESDLCAPDVTFHPTKSSNPTAGRGAGCAGVGAGLGSEPIHAVGIEERDMKHAHHDHPGEGAYGTLGVIQVAMHSLLVRGKWWEGHNMRPPQDRLMGKGPSDLPSCEM